MPKESGKVRDRVEMKEGCTAQQISQHRRFSFSSLPQSPPLSLSLLLSPSVSSSPSGLLGSRGEGSAPCPDAEGRRRAWVPTLQRGAALSVCCQSAAEMLQCAWPTPPPAGPIFSPEGTLIAECAADGTCSPLRADERRGEEKRGEERRGQ